MLWSGWLCTSPRWTGPCGATRFRHVQPELIVQGPAVGLKWLVLVCLVQRLSSSVDYPVLDSSVCGPAAAEPVEQITAYQALALQALAGLAETLEDYSPLLFELVATLAKSHAIAVRVSAATHASANEKQNRPDPLVLDKRPASTATILQAVHSLTTGTLPLKPVASIQASPALEQTPERSVSTTRRTFRDIVQYHPRANSKRGFTVRELCRAMRISAASLREAHVNPGRLSLNAVSALATLMQESLLLVLADLLTEAEDRKKKRK